MEKRKSHRIVDIKYGVKGKRTASSLRGKVRLHPTRIATTNSVIHYVMPLGNGWVVKNSAKARFTVITDNKIDAVNVARKIAGLQKSTLIIHNKNGSQKTENFANPV